MKLTKSVVECLPAPARGYTLHWDGELKGFGVRVTARGVKTFVLQRRVNGKERRITIGRLGPLSAGFCEKPSVVERIVLDPTTCIPKTPENAFFIYLIYLRDGPTDAVKQAVL